MSRDAKIDTIAASFKQRILDGEYGTSGRLPSHKMLAEEYHTTHETINRVTLLLQAEGILVSKGRAGIFVSRPRPRIPSDCRELKYYLKEYGLVPMETILQEAECITAPAEVAQACNIRAGSPLLWCAYRQGTTKEHYRYEEKYYPSYPTDPLLLEHLRHDVHFDVLLAIKKIHGDIELQTHEEVIARLATKDEQNILGVVRNTPVLETQRTHCLNTERTVVMFTRMISVASYFLLSYDYITL